MIAELLPLLVIVAVVTIARNVFEVYVLERGETRQTAPRGIARREP